MKSKNGKKTIYEDCKQGPTTFLCRICGASFTDVNTYIVAEFYDNHKCKHNLYQQFMTVKELAKYLKCGQQTIYNWVHDKKIPFTKVGDLLRFRYSDIDEWINNGRVKPNGKK